MVIVQAVIASRDGILLRASGVYREGFKFYRNSSESSLERFAEARTTD